jgi:YYY domain-containing protein
MVQGVALAQNHSLFYQLLILWGLPTILVILFLISVLWEMLRSKENRSLYRLLRSITVPDLYVVILGLCAMGLVLIPELVYVRDIYENGNARANTMFKLTYQAYIMFGIAMGYVIFRLILVSRQKILKVLAGIGLFFLIWTLGYFGNSVSAWFGQVSDPSQYQGLNALNFLESDFAEDASAIHWLKENIQGSPVVLEANGDSYTGYERVSASTGLPTILGWYVHEWLWRNDVADLNQKSADVESIYTSSDVTEVQRLLSQYDVSYIFVGSMEREKYGDLLNESLLQSLGEIVYQDPVYDTYIIKLY